MCNTLEGTDVVLDKDKIPSQRLSQRMHENWIREHIGPQVLDD